MINTKAKTRNQAASFSSFSHSFYDVYWYLNRKRELNRLINWASRKKLRGPLRLYQNRLIDTEKKLLCYKFHSTCLVVWAQRFHWLAGFIRPTIKYTSKGAASFYRDGIRQTRKKLWGII